MKFSKFMLRLLRPYRRTEFPYRRTEIPWHSLVSMGVGLLGGAVIFGDASTVWVLLIGTVVLIKGTAINSFTIRVDEQYIEVWWWGYALRLRVPLSDLVSCRPILDGVVTIGRIHLANALQDNFLARCAVELIHEDGTVLRILTIGSIHLDSPLRGNRRPRCAVELIHKDGTVLRILTSAPSEVVAVIRERMNKEEQP